MWQKLCITRSAEKPRQASSFISSRVIGPVVSWEPTVVISGSQLVPGRTPARPQALPTIFWARVKPLPVSAGATGRMNRSEGGSPSWARTLSVRAADQQRDAAAGAHLVGDRAGLELKAGHDLARVRFAAGAL